MASKHATTQYNHYASALNHCKELYSSTRIYHRVFADYLKAREAWHNSNHYQRLSQVYKAKLDGYADALFDAICHDALDFRFLIRDEWKVNTDLTSADYDWMRAQREYKDIPSGYFWKGTDKPWSDECKVIIESLATTLA